MIDIKVHPGRIQLYGSPCPAREYISLVAVAFHCTGETIAAVCRRYYIRIGSPVSRQVCKQFEIIVNHIIILHIIPVRNGDLRVDYALGRESQENIICISRLEIPGDGHRILRLVLSLGKYTEHIFDRGSGKNGPDIGVLRHGRQSHRQFHRIGFVVP